MSEATSFIGFDRAMTSTERMARKRQKDREAGLARARTDGELLARKAWNKTPAGKASERRRRRARVDERPFVGVDGEGCGLDEHGRQNYMLLRAGDRELYTGKPLSTVQCLDFLCDCPPTDEGILVGFAFGYDTTMILRDLPGERDPLFPDRLSRRERLFTKQGDTGVRFVNWGNYAIEYLPKNYLRVARTRFVQGHYEEGAWVKGTRKIIKGSSRTIYETFGNFQKSFLRTLKEFSVGDQATLEMLSDNKDNRATFTEITPEIREYCRVECQLLAEVMEKFRANCLAAGIRPRSYNGAGKLSSTLHGDHLTMTAKDVAEKVPREVLALGQAAYFGGRFECTRIGDLGGPIHEYDIKSAYPAMMRALPCLMHGTWVAATPGALRKAHEDPSALYVAPVRFRHVPAPGTVRHELCGLPIRQKNGRLFWPVEGQGVYWSPEIRSAAGHGCRVVYRAPGWLYVKQCDCRPFDWVEDLYEVRKALGADLMGYPIKLAINGLYGKLAQRIGNPKFANLVWAGLITAMTRAALNDAAALAPNDIAMFATDALFSMAPLPLPIGESLGQWETKTHERVFIVQPGIYWGASRPKTRGVSPDFFVGKEDTFERAWEEYRQQDQAAVRGLRPNPPIVPLSVRLFVGLKLAQARGKPETAGIWGETERKFRFDWGAKRAPGNVVWQGGMVLTRPPAGGPDLVSLIHGEDEKLVEEMDLSLAELEDQPDPFVLRDRD
jgi:hypothetical protein